MLWLSVIGLSVVPFADITSAVVTTAGRVPRRRMDFDKVGKRGSASGRFVAAATATATTTVIAFRRLRLRGRSRYRCRTSRWPQTTTLVADLNN